MEILALDRRSPVGRFSCASVLTAVGALAAMGCSTSSSGDEVATLQMRSFAVPPQSEVYKCQNISNPFNGETRYITKIHTKMATGSHHLLLFAKRFAVTGSIEDCAGTEFETPGIYGSQEPEDEVDMPPGVGVIVEPTTGFRIQAHYYNLTPAYIGVSVQTDFTVAPRGTSIIPAGMILNNAANINVPPRSSQSVTVTCKLKTDLNIVMIQGHMHSHGSQFDAHLDDALVYQTYSWEHPEKHVYSPAMAMKKGQVLTNTCLIQNPTDETLVFGPSAAKNEMCVLAAIVYPYPNTSSDVPFNPCE